MGARTGVQSSPLARQQVLERRDHVCHDALGTRVLRVVRRLQLGPHDVLALALAEPRLEVGDLARVLVGDGDPVRGVLARHARVDALSLGVRAVRRAEPVARSAPLVSGSGGRGLGARQWPRGSGRQAGLGTHSVMPTMST